MEVKQVPNMLDKETQIYNNDPHLFVFDDEVTFLLVKFLFGCAKKKCWIWKEVVSSNIKIKIDILFKLLFHIYIYIRSKVHEIGQFLLLGEFYLKLVLTSIMLNLGQGVLMI